MNLHTHFLFPFATALILNKFGIISWKLVLLSGILGVLIDADHYIEYIIHAKSNRFSLKGAWNNAVRYHRFEERSFIHHWQGFSLTSLIIFAVFFSYWQISLVLAIAYYSHMLLDHVHLKKEKFFKQRVGKIFLKESHLELGLDLILILIIIPIILLTFF